MTNERAIQLLHRLQDEQFDGVHGDERREALEMAVKAMEALGQVATDINVGDTISRQAAIDAVAKWFHDDVFGITESDGTVTIFKRLRELPSAQPERKKGKCIWCDSSFRIEYYWIDRYGNTASFQDEESHIVATGIAKFCPNCGRRMESENE